MELPKSGLELAVWLGMQFPVAAVVVLTARWAIRQECQRAEETSAALRRMHERLLGEKDVRIAERD